MGKSEIIAQLQKDILPLQGYRSNLKRSDFDIGLGPVCKAFPSAIFPTGAVHEFFCSSVEEATASTGFISGILSALMRNNGTAVWIGTSPLIFPPALKAYGIQAEHIIFLTVKKDKEMMWAIEEALKCTSLSAVIGEISDLTFTASRRFQLAVEGSGVTSFLIRRNPRNLTTACLTRWHIRSLPSDSRDNLPGLSHPRWEVKLLKVRGGTPGIWELEWKGGKFQPVYKSILHETGLQRKAG